MGGPGSPLSGVERAIERRSVRKRKPGKCDLQHVKAFVTAAAGVVTCKKPGAEGAGHDDVRKSRSSRACPAPAYRCRVCWVASSCGFAASPPDASSSQRRELDGAERMRPRRWPASRASRPHTHPA